MSDLLTVSALSVLVVAFARVETDNARDAYEQACERVDELCRQLQRGTADLQMLHRTGIRAVQSTPLISRAGKLIGVLSTHWREPHRPLERELRLLDILARQASDLVERRKAEESHSRQRRLYEAILNNTPDLAYVFDLDHRFIYANEGLLKMWGKTREEAIGRNCLELGYETWHAEMHEREIDQVVATKQPVRGEVPFTGETPVEIAIKHLSEVPDTPSEHPKVCPMSP